MRIFVGGITGSGKSTVAGVLKERGLICLDDSFDQNLSYWANKQTGERAPEPVDFSQPLDWNLDGQYLQEQFESAGNQIILIFDNAANQSSYYHLFDRLLALVADNKTIEYRIRNRVGNSFGKDPDELAWVLKENERLTRELRSVGALAIDANKPVEKVVNQTLSHVN